MGRLSALFLLLAPALIGALPARTVAGFIDIGLTLPPLGYSSVAWADYDSDGDLDLTCCGYDGSGGLAGIQTHIYRNDAGAFTDILAPVAGLNMGTVAWGDYDNDGDLDLLLSGILNSQGHFSALYRNDSGSFTLVNSSLGRAYGGTAAWGDYDNDGRLDLIVTGANDGTTLFHNDGGDSFTDAMAGLPATGYGGSAAWGDWDGDGDLDLGLAGSGGTRLFRNDAGSFTDSGAVLPTVAYSAMAWGDCDNDGDLDLALVGESAGATSYLLRNDGGTFHDTGAALPGVSHGSVAWGDCDNDGDLDLLLAGNSSTHVCRNDGGGSFVDIDAGLAPVQQGAAAWGDFDNDGRLDIALAGGSMMSALAAVYRNDGGAANSPPRPPVGLASLLAGRTVTLSWDAGSDAETPAAGLTYNIRIGSTPGAQDLFSGLALPVSGWRLLPAMGNAQSRRSWSVTLPRHDTWYWSVQSIDGALAGSGFAAEQSFSGGSPPITLADIGAGLPGVGDSFSDGEAAWGDCDNDGDLDLALSGRTASGPLTRLYRNDGGLFVDTGAGLIGVYWNALAWGDYDNDGDLDLFVGGYTGSGGWSGVYDLIYQNDGQGHLTARVSLPKQMQCTAAWGDFDNDGDLDLAMAGVVEDGSLASRIYRNSGGSFSDIGAGLIGVSYGGLDWGDCDNDGDLDLALIGSGSSGWVTRLYRNDGGTFVDSGAMIDAGGGRSIQWGDCDGDGDLDLAAGSSAFRNDAGTWTRVAGPWPTGGGGSIDWGDYDNDGDLDLLYTGSGTRVFRNSGNIFPEAFVGLTAIWAARGSWADYDNDGDLDILLAGNQSGTWIYRSDGAAPNTCPEVPAGLQATVNGDLLTLAWNAATDAQTPAAGLSYNLRIGTTIGGQNLMPAMSLLSTGHRLLPGIGNAQQRTSWTIHRPPTGGCIWSVQTVDGNGAASPFSAAQAVGWADFLDTGISRYGAPNKSAAWGDYDNDGDLDLLLGGYVHRNDGGDSFVTLPELRNADTGAATWGDYDRDGDLDALIVARDGSGLYRNDARDVFTRTEVPIPDLYYSSAAFGDYDNDGDLDIVVSGINWNIPGYAVCRIYRNDHGSFVDINAGLPGVHYGSTVWGDYDNDRDLDLLVTGWGFGDVSTISRVYRNDGGTFVDINAGLIGTFFGSGAWGDYDADGDLDILLTGLNYGTQQYYSRIYRNDGSAFTDIDAGLPGVMSGMAAWADYDNDGDLDLAMIGDLKSGGAICRIYRNDQGAFVDIDAGLPGSTGSVAWGDYDNDGRIDLIAGGGQCRLYRNIAATPNTRPDAPGGLSATVGPGYELTLHWNPAGDAETPASGLSYNIRVRTTPGHETVVPAMADSATGFRRVAALGNAQCGTSWKLVLPHPEHYSWSVQAIDGAFAGSPFSEEMIVFNATRCQVEPEYLDFGTVSVRRGESADRSFRVRNISDIPLSGNISETCPYYEILSGGGPFTLAPGESLSATVRFRPTAYWTWLCAIDLGCPECPVVQCSGTGDDPTPVALSITAGWGGNSVDLTWEAAGVGGPLSFALDRTSPDDDHPFDPTAVVVKSLGDSYRWRDLTTRPDCSYRYQVTLFENGVPGGRAEATIRTPAVAWQLLGNRPNPFAERTEIDFSLPEPGRVRMDILDIRGRVVRTIDGPWLSAGRHAREWDGRDQNGTMVPNGIYFCRIHAAGQRPLARKVLLAR